MLQPSSNLAEVLAAAVAANHATTPEAALTSVLVMLGQSAGWDVAHAYLEDESGELVSTDLWWLSAPERFAGLRSMTRARARASTLVLPASLRAGVPYTWTSDLERLTRGAVARAAGLGTAAAFPMGVDGEITGILELWSCHVQSPAPELLETMRQIGIELGHAIERRRAQVGLATSETHLRTMFETAAIGMAIVSRDGRLHEVNPALCQMLGYTPAELHLISVDTLTHPIDREATRRRIAETGATPQHNERRLLHKDGSTVWCVISGAWVPEPGNQPSFGVAVVEDVTVRKQSERAVRELSGRLLHLQDQERRKIARALHESPAQNLAALAVNLAVIQKTATLEGRARAALDESIKLIDECSREIRTLSHLLHPPLLEEVGLSAALRWYVDGFVRRSAIEVALDLPDPLARLPVELETTLFRVVQESLTNIHRHSGSRSASIRVSRARTRVVLEIVDQGRGIRAGESLEDTAPGNVGVGIAGMRERVRQLAGELTIDTGPSGTTVRVELPTPAPEAT